MGRVAASRICCFRILAACLMANPLTDMLVDESGVILKKPGKFTPEERTIMMTHTWQGAWLFVDKQSDFDELAQIVVLSHHENWDGTGYPGHVDVQTGEPTKTDSDGQAIGKKGKEIPIMGRIVSLADVYDALRSSRVYKEKWTEEDTLREMRKLAGTKFDPELVDIFFEVLPSIQTVSARYAEAEAEENGGKNDPDSPGPT